MTNLIGKSLGRYHILEQLGEGGMAVVYKAFDTRLETEVAVKIIRTENILPKALPRTLKRFEREAKALAKLTHPNIVKVSDYGDFEGMPYLVMPYLPGGTLKAKMGKPMDWQEAVPLLLPIANALEYAHEEKLIHRDVKPANILLTDKKQPMLSDFGVAKIFDLEETVDLTGTGMGIGTPEYMAPEQWTGKTTAQSDIYALGIVLYEALTGRKPYSADTPAALLLKQANDPLPRPKQFISNLPSSVEKTLLKALAKDPKDRYQNMGEMATALEKLAAGVGNSKLNNVRKAREPREKREKAFVLPKWIWWGIFLGVGVGLLFGVLNRPSLAIPALIQPSTPLSPLLSTKTPAVQVSSKENTHQIVVEANKKWNDTGILIQEGDVVQITYISGKWRSSPEYPWIMGDNCDDKCDDCLLPMTSEGSLVAKIGNGNVYCGISSSTSSESTGNLFLSFNDCPSTTLCFDDNEGNLEIQVVILDRSTPNATSTHEAATTPELGIGSSWERPADEMTMFYIPTGEFEMGSNDGKKDEKPVHTVYLDAYWIDQTEVTNAMYTKCWQAKVCNLPTDDKYFRSYEFRNHPVAYVSWEDASIYCEWAGTRLPTEAEWEKAARGNTHGSYPWGSVINKTYANYHGNVGNTQPVGVYSRSKNVYGLDDMAGNVWEFTADWYSSNYYSVSPTKNPAGPEQADSQIGDRRVVRGGSWGSTAEDLRVFNRNFFDPLSSSYTFGFRCARDVIP